MAGEIVEGLYGTIAESRRWMGVLEDIRLLMEGEVAVIGVIDTLTGTGRSSLVSGPEALIRPLLECRAVDIPFLAATPHLDFDTPYTVDAIYEARGMEIRDRWFASPLVLQWAIPNELDDFFLLCLLKQEARAGVFAVLTDRKRRKIDDRDLERMSALSPHIRRAVTIGDLFERERAIAAAFEAIVAALAHPVLVVAEDLRLLFANPAAEALMREGVVVRTGQGGLSFPYGPAHGAVARAVALGVRDEVALGAAGLNVPLAAEMRPAVAHVLPLARREPAARLARNAAAAVFVSVAGQTPTPAMEAIAALFGLTAAERRVVQEIAAGRTRKEIAAAHGLADGTIKSQLAAIFDKTGTDDQRALEQLVRDLSPPTCPPSHD